MEIVVSPAVFDGDDWTPEMETEISGIFEGMITLDELDKFSEWLDSMPSAEG